MCTMSSRDYCLVSGGIFTIVALAHLMRLINKSILILGSWHVPVYMSFVGLIIAGFLSYQAFLLAGIIKK